DISQLPVVGLGPHMRVGLRVNQLHTDPHLVARSLHLTFKNIRYAKLLRVLGKIVSFVLIQWRGSARNYFQICNASQSRQNLLVDTISEVSVSRIGTEVLKREHSDAFFGRSKKKLAFPKNPAQGRCQSNRQCDQSSNSWFPSHPFAGVCEKSTSFRADRLVFYPLLSVFHPPPSGG